MTLLFLETCLPATTLSLYNDAQNAPFTVVDTAPKPSERLHQHVADLMQEMQLTPQDISGLVVTLGPGSFTGARVGLAFAEAWRLALDIPVYTFTTLQALSISFLADHPNTRHTVLLDTLTQDVYTQTFTAAGHAENDPTCIPQADTASIEDTHFVAHALDAGMAQADATITAVQWNVPVLCQAAVEQGATTGPLHPLYVKALEYRKMR